MAEELEAKEITAQEFAALDFSKITVLDLREPDEVLVHPIKGAINIPFSRYARELSSVPREKPVYAICRTGDWSVQVAEILADRGYTVYNVLGGTRLMPRLWEHPALLPLKKLPLPHRMPHQVQPRRKMKLPHKMLPHKATATST